MSGDQQQYIQEQERRLREQAEHQAPSKSTLEVVELERQNVPLPAWQKWAVYILAGVGALTIIYLILDGVGVIG